MALLRECLQQLRVKQHDWDAPDNAWPETKLHGLQRPGPEPNWRKFGGALPVVSPLLRADGLNVRSMHA